MFFYSQNNDASRGKLHMHPFERDKSLAAEVLRITGWTYKSLLKLQFIGELTGTMTSRSQDETNHTDSV